MKLGEFGKILALVALWASVWYLIHGELYQPTIQSLFPSSTTYIVKIVLSFLGIIVYTSAFIYMIFRHERSKGFRSFFRIECLDVKGILITLSLGILIQTLNAAFLYRAFLQPAREWIASLGLSGVGIGLGSGEAVPPLNPPEALFLTAFLIAFWWVEVPEELFFRGYVQNRLEGIVGRNIAVPISALLWDLAHLWGLVNIVERYMYGLIYGVVFRFRRNTTSTMIPHPTGNRAFLLTATIPQIWGLTFRGAEYWILLLVIYLALPLLVIAVWKYLRLDRYQF